MSARWTIEVKLQHLCQNRRNSAEHCERRAFSWV